MLHHVLLHKTFNAIYCYSTICLHLLFFVIKKFYSWNQMVVGFGKTFEFVGKLLELVVKYQMNFFKGGEVVVAGDTKYQGMCIASNSR